MHVSLRGITKRFGSILANDQVDLDLEPGRVTALLGENGAGKSTLLKILFGVYRADGGEIRIDGHSVIIDSPRAAINAGIGMVFQQFSLIPALTVRENLALSHPRTPWWLGRGARAWSDPLEQLRQLAPGIDPDRKVAELSIGEAQSVELAKVLNLNARLVILDEPTSVLTPDEAERLWAQVRNIAQQGAAVALVTHKLEDVFACAAHVAVMRGGRMITKVPVSDTDALSLVHLIVGEETVVEAKPLPPPRKSQARVWIRSLSASESEGGVRGIDLQIAAGEIVGIAGVSGNGQRALADAVAGLMRIDQGEVIVDGVVLQARGAEVAAQSAIAYLPEEPRANAIAPDLSVAVNLYLKRIRSLPFLVDPKRNYANAKTLIESFDIRPPEAFLPAGGLSGGNLQKLVAARELSGDPALVVACYPTMGLDLGASAAVYDALFAHAQRGACVLWISEDLDDLLRYAHRIGVMLRGELVEIVDASATTKRALGARMVGHATRVDTAHA